jgi:hypothetical protein
VRRRKKKIRKRNELSWAKQMSWVCFLTIFPSVWKSLYN